jgi:hypothetical protein
MIEVIETLVEYNQFLVGGFWLLFWGHYGINIMLNLDYVQNAMVTGE